MLVGKTVQEAVRQCCGLEIFGLDGTSSDMGKTPGGAPGRVRVESSEANVRR